MGTSHFSQLGLDSTPSPNLPPHTVIQHQKRIGLQPVASTLQRVTRLTKLGFECHPFLPNVLPLTTLHCIQTFNEAQAHIPSNFIISTCKSQYGKFF